MAKVPPGVYSVSQKSLLVGMGVHVPSASRTSGVTSWAAMLDVMEAMPPWLRRSLHQAR